MTIRRIAAAWLLCLTVMVAGVSCNDSRYAAPITIEYVGQDENMSAAVLDYDSEMILDLLNNGEWVDDLTNCGHDYVFTINHDTIRYHSECGAFNDITNQRAMIISETDKETVNEILVELLGRP